MMPKHKNRMYKQQGFSLIEALVAFLILSVGMLGIASLQMISLKAGHTAALRTTAVIKVEEIMERIRNNPVVVMEYIANAGDPGNDNNCNDYAGSVTKCNASQLARDDVFNWKADLKTSLPDNAGTTASIEVQDVQPGVLPAAIVTVTINWQERNPETQTMDNMSYSASAQICNNTAC